MIPLLEKQSQEGVGETEQRGTQFYLIRKKQRSLKERAKNLLSLNSTTQQQENPDEMVSRSFLNWNRISGICQFRRYGNALTTNNKDDEVNFFKIILSKNLSRILSMVLKKFLSAILSKNIDYNFE